MIRAAVSKVQIAALVVLGVVVIAVLLWIGLSSPEVSCGGEMGSPATAFQSASSATDLESIFGADSSECRTTLVKGLKVAAMADLFLFIPVYALFLSCFAVIINSRTKATTFFLAASLVATIVGDVLETTTQLIILAMIDKGAPFPVSLPIGNILKIFGLASVVAGLSYALWRSGNNVARLFAVLLGLCAIFRIVAFAIEPLRPLAPLSALAAYMILVASALACLPSARTPTRH